MPLAMHTSDVEDGGGGGVGKVRAVGETQIRTEVVQQPTRVDVVVASADQDASWSIFNMTSQSQFSESISAALMASVALLAPENSSPKQSTTALTSATSTSTSTSTTVASTLSESATATSSIAKPIRNEEVQ
jgi:hypothetical protein